MPRFKKILYVTLFGTALSLGCIALSACLSSICEVTGEKHSLTYVPATKATCLTDGNTEFWVCSDCGKYFADAKAREELEESDWLLPATGHSYSEKWSFDETYHWHASACEHMALTADKAEHNFIDGVCSECGYSQTYSQGIIFSWINQSYVVTGLESWATPTTLVIPSTYNELPVTAIWDNAFAENTDIEEVVIPDSIEQINSEAFSGCVNLRKVHLQSGLVKIRSSAFADCLSLTEIVIPDSVISIDYNAFKNCYNLYRLTLGASVRELEATAFLNCVKLVEVYNRSALSTSVLNDIFGNTYVYSAFGESKLIESGDFVFYPKSDKYYLLGYTGTSAQIILPDDIEGNKYSLMRCAFYANQKITRVEISDGVEEIGWRAFKGCHNLMSIVIPKKVPKIQSNAFEDCYRLVEICNKSDTEIEAGSEDYGYIGYYAENIFKENTDAGKFIQRGNYIFYNYGEEYILVKYTGKENTLSLPANIGGYSYHIGYYSFLSNKYIESLTIPSGVTEIKEGAFSDCSSLKDVKIEDGIETIGAYAFARCYDLENLSLPFTLRTIGDGMCYECNSITDITIPAKVGTIGAYAFYNCTFLSKIVIPDSVTKIGDYAFYDCDSLTSAIIGNGVKTIGASAFYSCDSLYFLTLGKSITTIGMSAFSFCFLLSDVTLPEGLKEISTSAFANCIGLKEIIIPDSVTTIGDTAFSKCGALRKVDIGDGTISIGVSAFFNCSNLAELTLGKSLKTIGYSAFANCIRLSDVILPDGVTTIDSSAFSGCIGITDIILPDSVTKIGYAAFRDCISLYEIVIGNGVTNIGNYAFDGCDNLKTIYYNGNQTGWDKVLGNYGRPENSTLWLFSATKPTSGGNYWHFVDDKPVKW